MDLPNITTDGGELATKEWLRGRLGDALGELRLIKTTGDKALDAELLAAEQAIRRVVVAVTK